MTSALLSFHYDWRTPLGTSGLLILTLIPVACFMLPLIYAILTHEWRVRPMAWIIGVILLSLTGSPLSTWVGWSVLHYQLYGENIANSLYVIILGFHMIITPGLWAGYCFFMHNTGQIYMESRSDEKRYRRGCILFCIAFYVLGLIFMLLPATGFWVN